MPGASDYAAKATMDWETGVAAMPAVTTRAVGLFTAMPNDSGTGGTEVSGGSYARVQCSGFVTTSASTASGAVLTFSSVPAWVTAGMTVRDNTSTGAIAGGVTVLSVTTTTVTLSSSVSSTVGSGDSIFFTAWPASSASSGAEPNTAAATVTNGATLNFPTPTGTWGVAVGFGLFDALTGGNLIRFDFLGAFDWKPFSGSNASPGVLTSPAHGFLNGDSVAVTAKYDSSGLPATSGSWGGILTVAGVTTDTFTAGVNTTATGSGLVRKVGSQTIGVGATVGYSPSTLTFLTA